MPKQPSRLSENLAPYLSDESAGVTKFSISLPSDLVDEVRRTAVERGTSASATIAAALRKAQEPGPNADDGDQVLKRLLPDRHWFALVGLAKIRGQTVEDVLAEAVDAWLAAHGVRLVRDEEWRRRFAEFLAARNALAEQHNWTDEEIQADVDAAVKEVREARTARRR
jgi:Arc/MetJ-type ribon-helix-helix transcriptional regulator